MINSSPLDSPVYSVIEEEVHSVLSVLLASWHLSPPESILPIGEMSYIHNCFLTSFMASTTPYLMSLMELRFYSYAMPKYPIVRAENGCWEWRGTRTDKGYGLLHQGRKKLRAHKYLYEEFVGPIPQKLVLDHLCRNKGCVNPFHLEPVTSRENTLRGEGVTAQNARKTHCSQGHPFDEANTFWRPEGGRDCLECNRAQAKRRREKNKQKAAADPAVAG